MNRDHLMCICRGSKDGIAFFYDHSALCSHNHSNKREDERQIMYCLQSSNTLCFFFLLFKYCFVNDTNSIYELYLENAGKASDSLNWNDCINIYINDDGGETQTKANFDRLVFMQIKQCHMMF